MNRIDIEARVLRVVALQMGVSEKTLTPETTFVADLGADSLDSVELCMSLEDEFGLEIADEDAERITNSAQVVAWIVTQPGFTSAA